MRPIPASVADPGVYPGSRNSFALDHSLRIRSVKKTIVTGNNLVQQNF
jgi:hypothetical protein